MQDQPQLFLGLDFGTESVRALLVDSNGNERGSASVAYAHGQITERLPNSNCELPSTFALQHPDDWLGSAARAVRAARRKARASAKSIIAIGVDFTSCTVLPVKADATPLCLLDQFAANPMAWPKLWKHHGAGSQADRIQAVAHRRGEDFLQRYGGAVSSEWLFPKLLETLEQAPEVYRAADLFIEAGDWIVWRLTGSCASHVPRSACQAGYKGFWSRNAGFPGEEFFRAVHPDFERVVTEKLHGRLIAPGQAAGELDGAMAKSLGLGAGMTVSAAIIDAHAAVPGAGAAEPGTLVMVMGTSSCHMLNSRYESYIPGIAGVVQDGILPGFFGYEAGQAAVGDAFSWLARLTGSKDLATLGRGALAVAPGAEGVRCIDWFNGCRTPLMNADLRGTFSGLGLNHRAVHLYRALAEATACGARWIIDQLQHGGVPVDNLIATGGLPHHVPGIIQVFADVLDQPIMVHPSRNGSALGAAILGALAAGAFQSPQEAITAMSAPAPGTAQTFVPVSANRHLYDQLYAEYREACDATSKRLATKQ